MTTLLPDPLIFTNRGIYKDDISLHGSIPCENCIYNMAYTKTTLVYMVRFHVKTARYSLDKLNFFLH